MTIVVTPSASPATFLELQTEFLARGYDYLGESTAGQTRAKRWLNIAYLQICEAFPWPFLETEQTGLAPFDLPSMRAILSVVDSVDQRKLDYIEYRELTDRTTDLSITGTPCHYWLDQNTLNTYPVGTQQVTVRYLAVPDELVGDDDETLVPRRFADLIVDGAVIRGLKDSDNYTEVAALQALYQADLMSMAASLMVRNHSGPDQIARRAYHLDG